MFASPVPDLLILSYRDAGTQDIHDGRDSKSARRTCPRHLWTIAREALDVLAFATALRDLAWMPGNQLEKLKRDRKGQHAIRLNKQYRICFTWTDEGPSGVEIVDYH